MRTLLVLAFLGLCCLPARIVEGVGSEVLEETVCVSLSTRRLPVKNIKAYTIKEGPMRAVILITKRGFKICANPQEEWVRKAVDHVNSSRKSRTQTPPTGAGTAETRAP